MISFLFTILLITSVKFWKSPVVLSVDSLGGLSFTGFFHLGLRRLRAFGDADATFMVR